MSDPSSVSDRSWLSVMVMIAACWIASFLGPLSFFIIPVVFFGAVAAVRRKSWIALTLLLTLNPTGVFFFLGVTDHWGGSPTLRFVGLPTIESFNLDRDSRCFRRGGGCVISGNEWVFLAPHNAALHLMANMFGPPSKSYDGPYPTEKEALLLASKAPKTPVSEFLRGDVRVDGATIHLGVDLVDKLHRGLRLLTLYYPEDDDVKTEVRALIYEERCIIVRVMEMEEYSNGNRANGNDIMVFIDRKTSRPFAYFTIGNQSSTRSHPVSYLPEHDR